MRGLALFLALLIGSTAVSARNPIQQPPPQGGAAPAQQASPAVSGNTAELDALRQRLLAYQQKIGELEHELADAKTRASGLEQCHAKNDRLVAIGQQLIQAYEHDYRVSLHDDPFQLGRRRFEAELQKQSEAIYENRVDVPVKPSVPQPAGAETAQEKGQ